MPFITKLDFSDNRQVKQYIETNTVLSGGTAFGVPFGQLPTGPDSSTSAITSTTSGVLSTFSGNSATTIYDWYSPLMGLADSVLSAWTPSNSATTQNTGNLFSGATSTTTVDGNFINLSYTGASFDVTPISMIDLGGGNYSGTVTSSSYQTLSAGTIDFSGRTIWVDVSGNTRTNELIVTKNPVVGFVLTCIDNEGRVDFQPASGGTSLWSASSGTNAIVVKHSDSLASGTNSLAEGFQTTASGLYSHAEGYLTTATSNTSHTEGYLTRATTRYAHAEGDSTWAAGEGSHTEGRETTALGVAAHAEGFQTTASGTSSHAGGYNTKAVGDFSFVHGSASTASNTGTIVLGNGITGSSENTVYVNSLNLKTVGAGPGVTDIGIDANGNVVNQASDLRLKQNITTIKNALSKIQQLRGVEYQWKDIINGGVDSRLGFIAQEVNEVEPLLTFTDKNSIEQYMGVQYKDITALLVEAIKELASGTTTLNKVYLETQTILAEDNNIDLNYGGDSKTAVGGGIRVLNTLNNGSSANLVTDDNGDWTTNNNFKPLSLTIPYYTPLNSLDTTGSEGNITKDEDFIYVKTKTKWKRIRLEDF